MFSFVEVSGPVFYLDWTGRRVEIRAQDSLTNDDLVSSLSKQSITIQTPSGESLVLNTDEPTTSIEDLIHQTSNAHSQSNQDVLAAEFNGSIISDSGIGAVGNFKPIETSIKIASQICEGEYGNLHINDDLSWTYLLKEEAVEGLLLDSNERAIDTVEFIATTDELEINFNFKLSLFGTQDIPEIIDCQLTQNGQSQKEKAIAEHEIMSMIGQLLSIN